MLLGQGKELFTSLNCRTVGDRFGAMLLESRLYKGNLTSLGFVVFAHVDKAIDDYLHHTRIFHLTACLDHGFRCLDARCIGNNLGKAIQRSWYQLPDRSPDSMVSGGWVVVERLEIIGMA